MISINKEKELIKKQKDELSPSYINLKKGGINTLEKLIELVYNDNLDIKYPYDRALIERIVKRIIYIYKINGNSEKGITLKKSLK